MSYTEKDILKALSHVQDPDLKKDLVTLNMIEDIKIEDYQSYGKLVGKVSV